LYLHITENPIEPHRQKDGRRNEYRICARRSGLDNGVVVVNDGVVVNDDIGVNDGVVIDIDTMVNINDMDLYPMDVVRCDVGGVEGRSYFR